MNRQLIIFCACILLIACNNSQSPESKIADAPKQPEVASNTPTNQSSGEGIAGYWKLTLEAYDENGNKILDEAERKKSIKNKYTFRFSADGSCRIQESFTGRYEVKSEGGKKMLYVYRNRVVGEEDKDPVPDVYRIISMNKTELVLLENIGDLTFWVFERAG
jgi:hypothetical protein